jgi:hypothetical protein
MGMNGRLLRPKASGHPEALAWKSAVIANGGTVSASTMTAVTAFCKSIDSAGIRNRLYRLNLFCGGGLTACLVPLYRGPSSGGTQYGNTTDTNNNFVSSDYAETGATSGLLGSSVGVGKWLDTGVPQNFAADRHISAVWQIAPSTAGGYAISAYGPSGNQALFGIYAQTTTTYNAFMASDAGAVSSTGTLAAAGGRSLIASNVAGAGGGTFYSNGAAASATTGYTTADTAPITVFGLKRAAISAPTVWFNGRLAGYSIGLSLTATQAAALNTAYAAFAVALGRTA